ncbi:LysR substrate-binding domain-containing protein [Salinicola halophilus]|uniref:LysR substrate-binding domain-containing protein n=1 Tax=Salinicola halophilus TaxID=184065 RepID=UPI000DA1D870|nr:LysR substrate-binding domain-containing protein [Salinicola halophilus]
MPARQLPSLSALRAFEAAARHLSAKRAAAELSVTPTAISHQIRQLEEHLGVALFIRQPRQLRLTVQGQELLTAASEAFDTLASAVARLHPVPERFNVTLSTIPAVAARWLLPRVSELRDAHPTLSLNLQISHHLVALDGVAADMAIRYGTGDWPGLMAERLFDNTFVPACSPALGVRTPDDLHHATLIHYEPPNYKGPLLSWAAWQKLARVPALDVTGGLVFSDETHTIAAALGGQGVALMSRTLIAEELADGRLIEPFGPVLPGKPFYLVYPPARRDEPAIQAVREWVLTLAGAMR